MKILKKLPLLFAAAICALLVAVICLTGSAYASSASATPYTDGDYLYGFEYERFDVTCDIKTDRSWHMTEVMEINFKGRDSTGIIRDLPVNAGGRVKNVKVYEMTDGGALTDTEYDVYSEETNLLSVKISDGVRKYGESRTYVLEYDFAMTNKTGGDVLFINAIGFGHTALIKSSTIVLNLPAGFVKEKGDGGVNCYVGKQSGDAVPKNDVWTFEGDDKIVAYIKDLNDGYYYEGVEFDITFNEGVLSLQKDFTPYYIVIAACVVLAALFALKFLVFNKNSLTPVVNTEAPDDMDPLLMGKLIDNKADKSDVTSLIYYWADKGFIKINFADEKNVELIKIYNTLPQGYPHYQQIMYNNLFKSGELVKVASLSNSFYSTVNAVIKEVNADNSGLNTPSSMAAAVIFTLIGALLMMLPPIIIAMTRISSKLFVLPPLLMIIPAFLIFSLTSLARSNFLKWNKGKRIGVCVLIILLAAVCSALYLILTPAYVMETAARILVCVAAFAIITCSVLLINRTDAYTQKLNKIVGFREFILNAEKDKLETMLEGNPEFYYHILPYAQVLGVSDIWTEKFKQLTIEPPGWAYGYDTAGAVFDFIVLDSVLRSFTHNITAAMISRPSSGSFSGGGFHGGGFGGGGGGFGGGGSRGC